MQKLPASSFESLISFLKEYNLQRE